MGNLNMSKDICFVSKHTSDKDDVAKTHVEMFVFSDSF